MAYPSNGGWACKHCAIVYETIEAAETHDYYCEYNRNNMAIKLLVITIFLLAMLVGYIV
jgi:hypothetical protein